MSLSHPHVRRRCKERYGVKLTAAVYARIVSDIQQKRARLKEPNRKGDCRQIWIVPLGNDVAQVVYDTSSQKLVTFLSRSSLVSAGVQ